MLHGALLLNQSPAARKVTVMLIQDNSPQNVPSTSTTPRTILQAFLRDILPSFSWP